VDGATRRCSTPTAPRKGGGCVLFAVGTTSSLANISICRGLVLGETLPDDAGVVLVIRRQQRHRPPLNVERQVEFTKQEMAPTCG